MQDVSVLFCCLGNICRSPTAHAVFETLVQARGLADKIHIDSAGTGDWHIGHAPDARSAAAAGLRGYQLNHLRARQVSAADFHQFDVILAMDNENLRNLEAMRPADFNGELALFLSYAVDADTDEVPDPYHGSDQSFAHVLDLVEHAAEGLLDSLIERYRLLPTGGR